MEKAIKKDALYDRMIADWKKAALVEATTKKAAPEEAKEAASEKTAKEEPRIKFLCHGMTREQVTKMCSPSP